MLYSKCNREPLNGFKQRSIIWLMLWRDLSGFRMKDDSKEAEQKQDACGAYCHGPDEQWWWGRREEILSRGQREWGRETQAGRTHSQWLKQCFSNIFFLPLWEVLCICIGNSASGAPGWLSQESMQLLISRPRVQAPHWYGVYLKRTKTKTKISVSVQQWLSVGNHLDLVRAQHWGRTRGQALLQHPTNCHMILCPDYYTNPNCQWGPGVAAQVMGNIYKYNPVWPPESSFLAV